MTQEQAGLLMVWTDIPAEAEAGFNEWYNREHLPDRINTVPGFSRARRFVAIDGGPKYLALYETRNAQVFRSEPYLAINREPDPTSRRYIPLFRNTIKGICDVTLRSGLGEGALLALLPVTASTEHDATFSAWACNILLPGAVASEGVVAATFAQQNRPIQQIAAASYTRAGDRFVDKLIIIEAANDTGLANALAALSISELERHGGSAPVISRPCTFRALFTAHA